MQEDFEDIGAETQHDGSDALNRQDGPIVEEVTPVKRRNQHKPCPPADIIRGHVTYYYTLGLSDSKIAESCQQHFNTEVYGLSNTTVKRLRAQWNLPKTRQQNHTAVSIDPYCRALKARYPTYGARQMTSTLRITYNIRVSESMVGKWLKEFEPNAVQARKHRKFKRHQFWAAGVNDVWAFDQHDKWARFGLFLHLCIEPVAGEIKWLKIWWNNSNPRLITSYYLEAVRSIGAVPLVTQSDPGSENFGIANAQTYMRHTLDPTLADTLQHRWMRGHMNIKPEIMWSVLNRSWKPGFEAKLQYGIDNGWYNPANELETLVFRWLAIPWLQAELDAWALHFNSTPRRASKHKVLPQGIPTMIAQNPAAFNVVDFKIPVPADLVDEVEELWAPPDHPVFECVPPYIAGKLEEAIEALGRPAISMETFWAIYLQVLEYMRAPERQNPEEQALLLSSVLDSRQPHNAEPIMLMPGLLNLQDNGQHFSGPENADAENLNPDAQGSAVGWFTDEEDDGEDAGFF